MRTDEINIRDPFVLVHDGAYYLYGTRGDTCWGEADGFDVYTSHDLSAWEGPFVCFQKPEGFWADRNFWAPEVHVYEGMFYMFASFKAEGVCRGTAILRAETPMGPFEVYSDGPLTPAEWECLDGTFYVSASGRPYMVFCHEWVQAGDGEICAMELTRDLKAPAAEPFLLFRASDAPWTKWMTHSSGVRGCVTDGPFLYRGSTGALYCLWASFSEQGYTEGVAVSDNGEIDGHFRQIRPLFDRDGGHGMVFFDMQGHPCLTLHSPNTHLLERPHFIPLMEVNGELRPREDRDMNWAQELTERLSLMAKRLSESVPVFYGPDRVMTPEDAGYPGTGPATVYLQKAVDELALQGGGTLRLQHGDYVSGTLILRSHICLHIMKGARLLASTDLSDYPECHARRLTVQDTSMGMHQSLIFAEGCEDVCLAGEGEICGQGTPDHFPGEETAQGTPGRPFLMRFIDCRYVVVQHISLSNAACWMQNYLNCDHVLLDQVHVHNHANYNNDGLDLDGCRDVVVRHCDIFSGDDGICLKGAAQAEMSRVLIEDCDVYSACNAFKIGTDTQGSFRDILVRDCRLGGLETDPSGLKHPWADSGISLEMMDGGDVDGIVLQNIEMSRVWSPLFMRLENRGRVKPGDAVPGPGRLRHVVIQRLHGEHCGPRGSYFLGSPERAIEEVLLKDISIAQLPTVRKVLPQSAFGRMESVYPDAHMIDSLSDAPAYALWVRHVHALTLDGYAVTPEGDDARPKYAAGDDTDMTIY